MVEFKTKIIRNIRHNQHSITIPSYIFKQDLIEYDKNAEYRVNIEKIN